MLWSSDSPKRLAMKVMVGRRKKKKWRLADPLTVKVEKASLEDMRIDFSLED